MSIPGWKHVSDEGASDPGGPYPRARFREDVADKEMTQFWGSVGVAGNVPGTPNVSANPVCPMTPCLFSQPAFNPGFSGRHRFLDLIYVGD
jgi:hypothetical protein